MSKLQSALQCEHSNSHHVGALYFFYYRRADGGNVYWRLCHRHYSASNFELKKYSKLISYEEYLVGITLDE